MPAHTIPACEHESHGRYIRASVRDADGRYWCPTHDPKGAVRLRSATARLSAERDRWRAAYHDLYESVHALAGDLPCSTAAQALWEHLEAYDPEAMRARREEQRRSQKRNHMRRVRAQEHAA